LDSEAFVEACRAVFLDSEAFPQASRAAPLANGVIHPSSGAIPSVNRASHLAGGAFSSSIQNDDDSLQTYTTCRVIVLFKAAEYSQIKCLRWFDI
jgi:hypothetical protein